ncbi:hypothetical protein [Natrarchaeobaculum aegyptiacum]|uniref:Uncharacterized protein n=1 Tax=Natrarchaeobaculum aegyptiacum TaxID=745377 RepID=A0A2Z2HQV5_9EURY|nr:hypothetical protein [Natrarchaeobaculum aegyptiacum]ARS89382.1 hypothetical protein B1756_06215 [Natrarchaeobaculum aegyptiacum]
MDLDALPSLRTLEVALAIVVPLSAVGLFGEPAFLADAPSVFAALWFGAGLVAPVLLATVVVLRALAHVVRLVAPVVGHDQLRRPGDVSPLRILVSLAFGALAAYVLWWSLGTVYAVYFASVGGVLMGHLVAAVFGSVLALLVLLRVALGRLFPDGPAARLRRPTLE